MGFLDRVLGNEKPATRPQAPTAPEGRSPDEQALERYRYMLKTAPPETIEAAHTEAFAKLLPEQRRQVLTGLAAATPAAERAAAEATSPDDPAAMGRLATRAEMRQPGIMERSFGGGGGFGGSLLGSFAMGFAGSMIAQSFFSSMGGFGHEGAPAAAEPTDDPDQQASNEDGDGAGEDGAGDDMGGDMDMGGDF